MSVSDRPTPTHRWLEDLSDEDLSFIRRFILLSGSLKAVAREYGISYPTVRLRLDRLIQKIQLIEEASRADTFERRLRAEFADGRMDEATFHRLLEAYRAQRDDPDASSGEKAHG